MFGSKENPAIRTARLIEAEGFGKVCSDGRSDCCDTCPCGEPIKP